MSIRKYLILFFVVCSSRVQASVVPNSLFTDHLVLQRRAAIPVWGTGTEGEKVTVVFGGQRLETRVH